MGEVGKPQKAQKAQLTFYFDLQSPYAYLAHYRIRHTPEFSNYVIRVVPVLMLGLVKAGVAIPPWGRENKVRYLGRDLARSAVASGVPWRAGLPDGYPATPTAQVQRCLVSCLDIAPDRALEVVDVLCREFWVDKKAVQLPDVFEPILKTVLGTQLAEEVVHASRSQETRDRLVRNTEEAIASGAPGLPWFVASNLQGEQDYFWGSDRLNQVSAFLELPNKISPRI